MCYTKIICLFDKQTTAKLIKFVMSNPKLSMTKVIDFNCNFNKSFNYIVNNKTNDIT